MSTGMIYQITLIGKRAVNAERRFSAARNAMVKNQPVKMTVKRRVPLQSGFKKQPTFVVIFRLKPKPFQPAAGIGVQNERRFEKGIDEDYVRRFFSDTRQRQKLVPQAVLVDCLYRFAGVTVSGVPIGQRADSLCLPSCKAAGTEAVNSSSDIAVMAFGLRSLPRASLVLRTLVHAVFWTSTDSSITIYGSSDHHCGIP